MRRFKHNISRMILAAASAAVLAAQSAPTPAEKMLEQAEAALAKDSKRADLLSHKAMALARRARESADSTFYERALEAANQALALDPKSFEAAKAKTWILLGQHEFAQAYDLAKKLNRQVPDDLIVYGLLTDACVELGKYDEAEKAAQFMMDLRPGNIPALTRGAYLREMFGDPEGAIDFFRQALQRTRPEETEDRAWIVTHISHLQLSKGDIEPAEQTAQAALRLFSDYHYALAQLAKVRLAQGQPAAAAELLEKRYKHAPHPENLYDLGMALRAAGRKEEAESTLREFETAALRESKGWDNANRELMMYWLDVAGKKTEALELARMEIARRQDVATLDVYAWALAANGQFDDARKTIDKALAIGVRDAKMLYRAGSIASAQNDRPAALRYYKQSLAANASSDVSQKIMKEIAALQPASAEAK